MTTKGWVGLALLVVCGAVFLLWLDVSSCRQHAMQLIDWAEEFKVDQGRAPSLKEAIRHFADCDGGRVRVAEDCIHFSSHASEFVVLLVYDGENSRYYDSRDGSWKDGDGLRSIHERYRKSRAENDPK